MSLLARLDDLAPPEVVREARRDVRTRLFAVAFPLALLLALATTCLWAFLHGGVDDGPRLLTWLHAALAAVTYLVVPLGAWSSMDEEWGESRLDLLRLTRLSPARVLAGKVCAALLRAGLFVAAFAPFLALATLTRGVEPGLVLGIALTVALRSAALAALGLLLASLAPGRAVRSALALVLALACVTAVAPALVFAGAPLGHLYPRPTLPNQVLHVLHDFALTLVLLAGAYARLEHAAVNAATRVRAALTVAVVALLVRGWLFQPAPLAEPWWFGEQLLVAVVAVFVASTFFVTEEEGVRRHERDWIARRPRLAAFAAPWIPGRERGVLFLTTHFALIAVGTLLTPFVRHGWRSPVDFEGWFTLAALWTGMLGYSVCVLPAALVLEASRDPLQRKRFRVLLPVMSVFIGASAATMARDSRASVDGIALVAAILAAPAFALGVAQSVSGWSLTRQMARLDRYRRRRFERKRV